MFDEEYFLIPLPHIFTQMFTKGTGKPWSESGNDNSIMGLFVEWRRPEHYLYAQWLVDDISLDFLIDLLGLRDEFGNRQIPSKLAWSLGGYYDFPWGRVGLYHAGATKYTFEPTNASYPYGYTYQPAVTYQLEDGTPMPLYPWDNTVGYLYGENNLAFRVEYGHTLGPWVLGGALEYVVSGSKSPGNPWHEYTTYIEAGRKTLLLDDPVLEHVLSVDADVSWTWKWLTLKSRVRLGSVWTQLALESATDGGAAIFRPQPGVNSFLYSWTIGAELKWAGG